MTKARSLPWMVMVVGGALLGSAAFSLARPDGGTAVAPSVPIPSSAPSSPTTPTTPTTPQTSPTTSAALEPATEAVGRSDLVIQGVGDVNFDPSYIPVFAEQGYQVAFEGLEGVFHDDDVTVINLECPPTDAGTQVDKEYSFHCDPAALGVARHAGVEVMNLANNHGQDRGVEGLADAIANVTAAGMAPVGVGGNVAEATAPALLDVDGWTVAVLGMGGILPNDGWVATVDRAGMASGDDTDRMVASVEAAAKLADVVVVTIHWGTELVTEPDAEDRARAEAMVRAGADVIFGHHAHRLGGLEMIGDTPVFWTLGNFIWPKLSVPGATTAVARVVISPEGSVEACLIPAFIERSGRPELRGEPLCQGER